MPQRLTGAFRSAFLAAGLGAALFLLSAPLTASGARADFRVCNGTQSLVGVAIGYRAQEGWVSEGWWRIPATTCRSVVEGALTSRYYYVYAEDSEGVGRWGGDIQLCIAENEFKVVGVEDCFSRGYQEMGFREYDTGSQASWMVQLTPAPRNGEGATAGAQPNGAQPAGAQAAGAAPAADAAAAPATTPAAGETDNEDTQAQ